MLWPEARPYAIRERLLSGLATALLAEIEEPIASRSSLLGALVVVVRHRAPISRYHYCSESTTLGPD
jgi:hypothetical protein